MAMSQTTMHAVLKLIKQKCVWKVKKSFEKLHANIHMKEISLKYKSRTTYLVLTYFVTMYLAIEEIDEMFRKQTCNSS